MIFTALSNLFSSPAEDAPSQVSVGFFYTGIDRQDHARGIHGGASAMQLAQMQKADAMQADDLRAHGAGSENPEQRLACYRAADALEASSARAVALIEIEQAYQKAVEQPEHPRRPQTDDSSGDDALSSREARARDATQTLPLLKAENHCTADVMLARAERLAAAEPAPDASQRKETPSVADTASIADRPAPSAFDKMLSGISFDWARDASPQPQHLSDAASMRLAAPAFILPDFTEMKRRMQGQGLALAA